MIKKALVVFFLFVFAGTTQAQEPRIEDYYIILEVENLDKRFGMTHGEHLREGRPDLVIIGDRKFYILEEKEIYDGRRNNQTNKNV